MVTNGKLSNEDYSLSCIVCGSQDRVALVPHRAADKVRGIFCFCEKCWPEYAGATLRTEWIKDVGEVAPKDAAEALITSTNKRVMKPCAVCSSGPLDTCGKLCIHNVTFNDLFTPRKAS